MQHTEQGLASEKYPSKVRMFWERIFKDELRLYLFILGIDVTFIVVDAPASVSDMASFVFIGELVVLLAGFVRSMLFRPTAAPARPRDGVQATESAEKLTLGDDTLLDITSRYNEAVVSNIDAIDTALIAILALPVAFAVFAVDKLKELSPLYETRALTLLLAACLTSFAGYSWGFLIRGGRHGMQDGIVPRRFLADYFRNGPRAIADTIRTVNLAGDHNAEIRRVKRTFALAALVFFLLGAVMVVYARLAG